MLVAEIQKLKHSVPKGDKKKKKEVTAQIALLEADLDQKQEEELQQQKEVSKYKLFIVTGTIFHHI